MKPQRSPDGRWLACGTPRGPLVLWDTKTQKVARTFGKLYFGTQELLAFSPDGKTLATPGGNVNPRTALETDLVLWETATGQERLHIAMNEGQVSQIAFSPDGRLLASVGRTETIFLWDTFTGKEVGRFTGHRGWMNSLSFAPDGKTLASGGADSTVLIWDVSGVLPAKKPGGGPGPRRLGQVLGRPCRRGRGSRLPDHGRVGSASRPGRGFAQREARRQSRRERRATGQRLIADLDYEDFKARESERRTGPTSVA